MVDFSETIAASDLQVAKEETYLLHCVALIRSTSVTNQILLSEKLKVGQIERGVFQEETSARNAKNTLLIAQYH